MTQSETLKILAMLNEVYPNSQYKATEGIVRIWQNALNNTNYITAVMAFKEIVETKKFMPTLSEFKETVKNIEYEINNPWLDAFGDISTLPPFNSIEVSQYVYSQQSSKLKSIKAKNRMIEEM